MKQPRTAAAMMVISINPEDKKLLEAIAERQDRSLSSYVRLRLAPILRAYRKRLAEQQAA